MAPFVNVIQKGKGEVEQKESEIEGNYFLF